MGWLRLAAVLAATIAQSACVSPALPLPPGPGIHVDAPVGGRAHLCGVLALGDDVYVRNDRSGAEVSTTADEDGWFELWIVAMTGPELLVWQIDADGTRSVAAFLVVPNGMS